MRGHHIRNRGKYDTEPMKWALSLTIGFSPGIGPPMAIGQPSDTDLATKMRLGHELRPNGSCGS
jgi:hypothetical protein